MEIMQQSANHLDGRWRSHLLPYSGHALSSIPNLHSHIRQQMISQQPDPQQQQQLPHLQHSSGSPSEHLQQQQHHQLHQSPTQQQQMRQMSSQMQHRQVIVEHQQRRDPSSSSSTSSSTSSSSSSLSPTKDLHQQHQQHHSLGSGGSKAISTNSLPSPSLHLNSLTLQSSPSSASPSTPSTPSPPTPSPGKSGGKDGEEKKGEEWEQYNAGAAFLGPTLWDKTLSYDADLKVSLEYMDLDEFLNENGIPIEDSKRAGTNTTGGVNGSVGGLPSGTNSSLRAAQSPEAPSSPETSSPQMGSGMGACPQGAGVSSGLGAAPATSVGALSVAPPALSPQDYGGDCSSSVSSPGSPDPHSPLQVPEPESARASQGRDLATGRGLNEKFLGSASASSARATTLPSAAAGDLKSEVRLDYHISPNDLALATVPGQDFDPRTRCFSEEELKPQPMIKKSRKQFVPAEMKDEKYWARRRKNNLAAKRSRDARRLKENQIAMRANYLEKENLALRIQVDKATKEVESLKTRLGKYEDVEVKTIITGIGKFEGMKTNITEHTSSL